MKNLIHVFLSIIMISYSCDNYNFTKGVYKDAERLFESHKKFFKSLAFKGVISERKYCEKCQLNKYQVIIDLKEKWPDTIGIGDLMYPPYYSFNEKNQLNISLAKNLYDSLKEGMLIEKKIDSDSLICDSKKYSILSHKKSQWLPD